MNLYNIWVSLSEMSDKNIDLFHDILISVYLYLCNFVFITVFYIFKEVSLQIGYLLFLVIKIFSV